MYGRAGRLTAQNGGFRPGQTLKTGHKGSHASANGGGDSHGAPLPLPHTQTFDGEPLDGPGRLWYTQMGAWEVHEEHGRVAAVATAAAPGRELRQVATVWPNCWASQDCDPPKAWCG